ncbi:MAG TPA: hypothetical protein VGY58_06570 [Gemmataceae bacterium]|jgi:hypothetical protein|nr:hypothetical protein [Gemmataceae bacterium]
MSRALLSISLLALCFVAGQPLLSFVTADDAKQKKDGPKNSKSDDKSKDEKPDNVKRSQTTAYTEVTGKITKVDDTLLNLGNVLGRRMTLDDIIIADDVKVRVPAEREFDSKGKPKPFKPDPNDPDRKYGGVKGSKNDLREGQRVAVKLGKYKKKLVATIIVVLPEEKK